MTLKRLNPLAILTLALTLGAGCSDDKPAAAPAEKPKAEAPKEEPKKEEVATAEQEDKGDGEQADADEPELDEAQKALKAEMEESITDDNVADVVAALEAEINDELAAEDEE